jgi:hypothetical protein
MTPFERYRTVREVLSAEMARPYGYGWANSHSDCFFTGCRVADALDPSLRLVETYRGAYTTLSGAQRALRRRGFTSLRALFQTHLKPCSPAAGRVGDLAILLLADGEHVGVFDGHGIVTKTPRGRSVHMAAEAIAAFRTGR